MEANHFSVLPHIPHRSRQFINGLSANDFFTQKGGPKI
jgi:hypothetical protein